MTNEKKNGGSYSHILKYTGLFGGIQVLNILISLVRNKFVALILGPQGMGLISLFNSTITLVSNSTNLGIPMSSVKNISEAFERGDRAAIEHMIKVTRSWSLLTALIGMLLCVVLSSLLNDITFTWGDHTLHFVLLSPVVALLAITGGETAILKGTRRLKNLAVLSVCNIFFALIASVPMYYVFGEAAIVPMLIIIALEQMLLTIFFSYRYYPLKVSFRRSLMSEGMGMVGLGIAFVIAGILGSGADFVIRSFLNTTSSLDTVGLFSAGYALTMTYAGLVFSAMETDFFPRLSAVNDDREARNTVINRQIEVSVLLISPLLTVLMVTLPLVLPILYSKAFLPISGMVQVAIIAMYVRAVKLPIAYLTLAKGDSLTYLLLEGIYDIIIVAAVLLAFSRFGLTGAGAAITIAGVIDFAVIYFVTHWKYGFCLTRQAMGYFLIQLPIGLTVLAVVNVTSGLLYWATGVLLIAASTAISIYILHKKTSLWSKLTSKFRMYG